MVERGVTITGVVTRSLIAPGSKSEHEGVTLESEDGKRYVLRRAGGHVFRDAVLSRLVGKTITVTGLVTGQTLIADEWKIEGRD